ncbi:MAG: alpha/beta fold hydrolase [Akkermansiaceae bacterium]
MPSFTYDDFTMHYEIHGEGEPVLCIMGITAPGAVWEVHVEEWKKSFQCITPDNRGVGFSDKPVGEYTSEMMADDHVRLLDHLGIEKAHVVGCSMGSVIAQQVALRHPERVRSVTLMCSWARCDAYAKSVFGHILKAKAHFRAEDFMEYIQLLIFDKRSWDDAEFLAGLVEGREAAAADPYPQPLHGLEGQCAACVEHDTVGELKNLTAPCLVIGGENDIFTPRWMAEEIHGLLPNSEFHMYPDSGHGFHFENVEDFNERVAVFMRANS